MANDEHLKAVGFWLPNSDWPPTEDRDMPDPRWLVRRGWRRKERRQILAYLSSGHVYDRYAGFSYCRFRLCLTPCPFMGDADLTDGVWVWPQGLAHYVRRHSVCLPDEFIATMQANSWQVPQNVAARRPWEEPPPYDYSFWVAWSRQQKRRPWWPLW